MLLVMLLWGIQGSGYRQCRTHAVQSGTGPNDITDSRYHPIVQEGCREVILCRRWRRVLSESRRTREECRVSELITSVDDTSVETKALALIQKTTRLSGVRCECRIVRRWGWCVGTARTGGRDWSRRPGPRGARRPHLVPPTFSPSQPHSPVHLHRSPSLETRSLSLACLAFLALHGVPYVEPSLVGLAPSRGRSRLALVNLRLGWVRSRRLRRPDLCRTILHCCVRSACQCSLLAWRR